MANVTTSFQSLNAIKEIISEHPTFASYQSKINTAYTNINSAFSSMDYTYQAIGSSKTLVTLKNGDYVIMYGYDSLSDTGYFTGFEYHFLNSELTLSFTPAYGATQYNLAGLQDISVYDAKNSVTLIPLSSQSAKGIYKNDKSVVSVIQNTSANNDFSVTSLDVISNNQKFSFVGNVVLSQKKSFGEFQSNKMITDFIVDIMREDDNVMGTVASEYLFSFGGNDTLDGGAGDDTLDGGMGTDTVVYSGYKSSYTVSKNSSTYIVSSVAEGTDTLTNIEYLKFTDETVAIDDTLPKIVIEQPVIVPQAPSVIEQPTIIQEPEPAPIESPVIVAPPVVSTIIGTIKADFLTGTDNHDKILGLASNDTLTGGLGNDTLQGGSGKDLLVGGKGEDIFKYMMIKDSGITTATRDIISDFLSSTDKIDLSTIDANGKLADDQAFTFIGNAAFSKTNASGQLRFDSKTSVLYGSTDKDNSAEFSIKLNGVKSLSVDDLIL